MSYAEAMAAKMRRHTDAGQATACIASVTRERQLIALWLNSLSGETVDPLEVARMVLNGVHAVGEL